MSLSQLWKTSPEQIEAKLLHQVIAFAGDGKLRDDKETSIELRAFLSEVSSEHLRRYAEECLEKTFAESGFALQDIVNEIGRRLGLQVSNGRYRGTKKHVGYDGQWSFPNGHNAVVEVKTTDAYRIDTTTIAGYRKRLISEEKFDEEASSTLIVVGRQETRDLEAQIRGSRFAWDTRLISVGALLNLMRLKESLEDPNIIEKICQILIPREFTRLDEIVELVFFATEEAKTSDRVEEDVETAAADSSKPHKASKPSAFHAACVSRFGRIRGMTYVKRSRTSYSTSDKKSVLVCAVSKAHERQGHISYWFAFHPVQKTILEKEPGSYLLLGCGSEEKVVAIPFDTLGALLVDLWTTEKEDRMYWHIRIHEEGLKLMLDRRKGKGRLDVSEYEVQHGSV